MPKDWNTVSESGSSSDEEQIENQQEQVQEKQSQQSKQSISTTPKPETQSKKTIQQTRQKPKFISDQELIQKIKNKELDERRKIKIVNLRSEDLLEQIKNHDLVSYFKDVKIGDRPPFYIASFKTEQDLIQFIQQKIDNRYRFFLHPYIKSARDIERQEKYKQQREQNEKDRERDRYRGDNKQRQVVREGSNREGGNREGNKQGVRRGRNRPQYDEEEVQEVKQKERRREPKSEKQVEVKTQKVQEPKSYPKIEQPKPISEPKIEKPIQAVKTTVPSTKKVEEPVKTSEPKQFNYEIQKNQIRIKSNIYSKNRIADEVVYKKLAQKWDRIKIYVKKDGLDKVYELAEVIWQKIGYGLKAIPDQTTIGEQVEVILQNKCHVIHPNLQYGLLNDNTKKYFQKVGTKNKYLISDKFSLQEYVKEFRINQKEICKKWKEWIIKAQGDNVPLLLKLSWKLRKDLYLNVNIKVGARNQYPFAVLQIQPESDKDKRPKPDTSMVNNYLTN